MNALPKPDVFEGAVGDEEPTLFANNEVQAALTWKYGAAADYVFVESVWPLLDEYRAFQARKDKDKPKTNEPSLSWDCSFCDKLRVWEGGRPGPFTHLAICEKCGCRIAVEPADREAVKRIIDGHLL